MLGVQHGQGLGEQCRQPVNALIRSICDAFGTQEMERCRKAALWGSGAFAAVAVLS